MASSGREMTTGFPLALASMGVSVFVWSAYLGGWLPDPQAVAVVVIFAGGVGMLAAGIVGFRENAAFAGAANIGLSAFWFGAGFFFWFVIPSAKNLSADTAWAIVPWVIFTAILTAGVSRMKVPLLSLSMGLFFLALLLLWAFAAFHTGLMVLQVAGVVGIVSSLAAFVAFYQRMMREAV